MSIKGGYMGINIMDRLEKCLLFGVFAIFLLVALVPGCTYWENRNKQPEVIEEIRINRPHINISNSDDGLLENNFHEDRLFNELLFNFRKSKSYTEIALQNVIDLLNHELKLVRLLLYGHTGAAVDYALDSRNARLEYSSPSVVFIYNQILDLATNDYRTNQVLFETSRKQKRLSAALNQRDKNAFLLSMEDKLNQYQTIMRRLQYKIADGWMH